MKYEQIAQNLEGVHTINTIEKKLKVDVARAIYLIHKLRKIGYIKTQYAPDKKRIYYISKLNKQKGISYTEILNRHAPLGIQLATRAPYYIHGRKPTPEETLVYALKQNEIRYVIASLALFRKITNWTFLYKIAKKEKLVRQIAALYMVARLIVRKVRRIPKRFLHLAQPKKNDSFVYIVRPFASDDFKTIEKKWKVYIPLNRSDLKGYGK